MSNNNKMDQRLQVGVFLRAEDFFEKSRHGTQTRMARRNASRKGAGLILSSLAFFTALTGYADAQTKVLKATKDTVHWGYFSKKISPKLTIKSGEIVTVEMVSVSVLCVPVFALDSASCFSRRKTGYLLLPVHIKAYNLCPPPLLNFEPVSNL
jgi:hypothetical protein